MKKQKFNFLSGHSGIAPERVLQTNTEKQAIRIRRVYCT